MQYAQCVHSHRKYIRNGIGRSEHERHGTIPHSIGHFHRTCGAVGSTRTAETIAVGTLRSAEEFLRYVTAEFGASSIRTIGRDARFATCRWVAEVEDAALIGLDEIGAVAHGKRDHVLLIATQADACLLAGGERSDVLEEATFVLPLRGREVEREHRAVGKAAVHVMYLQSLGRGHHYVLVDVGLLEHGVLAGPLELLADQALGLCRSCAA